MKRGQKQAVEEIKPWCDYTTKLFDSLRGNPDLNQKWVEESRALILEGIKAASKAVFPPQTGSESNVVDERK